MSVQPSGTEPQTTRSKVTVLTLAEKKRRNEPLTMLTAYDYPSAQIVDRAGADLILVGDSLAMVVLGHPNTLSVTMDEMLHHARAVSRGAKAALLVGDLPFMSYQADPGEALRNAGRFVKEAGMDAVKLEGGRTVAEKVRAIVSAGIPVMGHVGLTPQSVNTMGGFRVQGRTASAAREILDDALALQEAGCFAVVLEGVPDRLAAYITSRLEIPTIGIGAGGGTSGQVLVFHDLVGLYGGAAPRFVKRYADTGAAMEAAVRAFMAEVEQHAFPDAAHSYTMTDDEWRAFLASVEKFPRPATAPARARSRR
jgi:3-methyl-2-oxobutanoate hydroxymethyltransferase